MAAAAMAASSVTVVSLSLLLKLWRRPSEKALLIRAGPQFKTADSSIHYEKESVVVNEKGFSGLSKSLLSLHTGQEMGAASPDSL